VLGIAGQEDSRHGSWAEENQEQAASPPPPEVPPSGRGAALLWRPSSDANPRTQLARHPLLGMVADSTASPAKRRSVSPSLSRLLDTANWWRRRTSQRASARSSGADTAALPGQRGDPLVVVVAGGRGGAGRTTLALEVANALVGGVSGAGRRVLVVDADHIHSDLDIKLGLADLDSDRCRSARIDRVLLQLPELADRRLHLDSVLWVHPRSGVRALLAPDRTAEIGREHLDYLYTYLLAPAFDAIVVDAGPAVESPVRELSGTAAFWLTLADSVLVPLRPTLSDVRAAMEGTRIFERLGVPTPRCRLVLGVARSESSAADLCQRRLREFVVVRWPWAPEVAQQASIARRALADHDRRFQQSMTSLLPALASARRIGR